MSARRAPPGKRVATGHMRVDAKRAIAKLREYQLADPSAWILEGVRAAVASQAEEIRVDADANDVWLAWHSEPWPDEILPNLLSELVSPQSEAGYKHRLLGMAVNSALSLNAAYIDVYSVALDGSAKRARYERELLVGEGEEAPQVEEAEPPAQALPGGMLVHLRKALGFDVFRNFVAGPRELNLCLEHCQNLGVPLLVDGESVEAQYPLSLPLEDGLDGFIALLGPDDAPSEATIEVAEHGVVIARFDIDVGIQTHQAPIPIRVFVNASKMPTNASRSDVKRDAYPVRQAIALAPKRYEALVNELTQRLRRERENQELRRCAFGLMRALVGGSTWATQAPFVTPPHATLFAQPLLKNALGEARSVSASWKVARVYTGGAPLDPELKAWLEELVWMPEGDPARLLFHGDMPPAKSTRQLIRESKKHKRAQERFLAHKPREAKLKPESKRWIACSQIGQQGENPIIDVASLANTLEITGEVALVREPLAQARITLLQGGRELEQVEIQSTIAFEACIDVPGLSPALNYKRSVRDEAWNQAIRCAQAQALVLAEAVVARALGEDSFVDSSGAGLSMAKLAQNALSEAQEFALDISSSPLARFPAFSSASDDAFHSLARLREESVLAAVTDTAKAPPLGRRLLLAVPATYIETLRALVAPTRVVSYISRELNDRQRDMAAELVSELRSEHGRTSLAILEIEDGPLRGAIAWGIPVSRLIISHAGRAIANRGRLSQGEPCAIVVDDAEAVPQDHSGESLAPRREYAAWEKELAKNFARMLLGQETSLRIVNARPPLLSAILSSDLRLTTIFFESLLHKSPQYFLGHELWGELRDYPWIPRFQSTERASLRDLSKRKKSFQYLDSAPALGPAYFSDWHPLRIPKELALLLGRVVKKKPSNARREFKRRNKRALRAQRLATHLRGREFALELPGPSIEMTYEGFKGLLGPRTTPGTYIEIRIQGRYFTSVTNSKGARVHAIFDGDESAVNADFSELKSPTLEGIETYVDGSIGDLLQHLSTLPGHDLLTERSHAILLEEWLNGMQLIYDMEGDIAESLHDGLRFPTVQGGRATIEEASAHDEAGTLRLRTAGYSGTWLASASTPHRLDSPIIDLGLHEERQRRTSILASLSDTLFEDLSDEVTALQAKRRIERGLVEKPAIPDNDPRFTMNLSELDASWLGPGELELVSTHSSQIHFYASGRKQGSATLETSLPIRVAVENAEYAKRFTPPGSRGADWGPFSVRLGELSGQAAVHWLEKHGHEQAPAWLRAGLIRASLGGTVDANQVLDLPLFRTIRGELRSWRVLREQDAMFGNVWYVPNPGAQGEPLDDSRVVVLLGPEEIPSRFASQLHFIDATEELNLDALARENRKRKPAAALSLGPGEESSALAVLRVDKEKWQGIVAPLNPASAQLRGLYLYREMRFLGRLADPCAWPTVSVVNDDRLKPNRTHSGAVENEALRSLRKKIREISQEATCGVVEAPEDALVSCEVDVSPPKSNAKSEHIVRGTLWLSGAPQPNLVAVGMAPEMATVGGPTGAQLPVQGSLLHYPNLPALTGHALSEVVKRSYTDMLEELALLRPTANARGDLIAAHLAVGIATQCIYFRAVDRAHFRCFVEPAKGPDFVELLEADTPVLMVDRKEARKLRSEGTREGLPPLHQVLIDDGTVSSQTIQAIFGRRVRKEGQTPVAPAGVASFAPIPEEGEELSSSLGPLRRAMQARLVQATGFESEQISVSVVPDRKSPLLEAEERSVTLAGDAPILHALSDHMGGASTASQRALDALCAHALTLLNHADFGITDQVERRSLRWLLEHS